MLLFQLITGERPFAGSSFAQIAYRVVNDQPDPGPLAADWPGLPEMVLRALAKRAEDRWPSAEAMADALRATVSSGAGLATVVNRAAYSAATTRINPASAPALPTGTNPALDAAVSPQLRALAEKELARFLGPIAKVLVKRALGSASPDAFRRALSEHIDKAADRAVFMTRTRE